MPICTTGTVLCHRSDSHSLRSQHCQHWQPLIACHCVAGGSPSVVCFPARPPARTHAQLSALARPFRCSSKQARACTYIDTTIGSRLLTDTERQHTRAQYAARAGASHWRRRRGASARGADTVSHVRGGADCAEHHKEPAGAAAGRVDGRGKGHLQRGSGGASCVSNDLDRARRRRHSVVAHVDGVARTCKADAAGPARRRWVGGGGAGVGVSPRGEQRNARHVLLAHDCTAARPVNPATTYSFVQPFAQPASLKPAQPSRASHSCASSTTLHCCPGWKLSQSFSFMHGGLHSVTSKPLRRW